MKPSESFRTIEEPQFLSVKVRKEGSGVTSWAQEENISGYTMPVEARPLESSSSTGSGVHLRARARHGSQPLAQSLKTVLYHEAISRMATKSERSIATSSFTRRTWAMGAILEWHVLRVSAGAGVREGFAGASELASMA